MKAVVFTKESISRLNRFGISDEWFSDYSLPNGNHGLRRVDLNGFVFLIEDELNTEDTPIVVVNLIGDQMVFGNGLPNALTLDRIITVCASHFFSSAQIPTNWRPYQEGNLLSVYAGTMHKGRGSRLHALKNPGDSQDLFFCSRTDGTLDFDYVSRAETLHKEARERLAEAILAAPSTSVAHGTAGIVLCERLPQGFVQGASLQQWYETKLTSEQRKFVDLSYSGPVRLRGSAGTGKTISMVIKFLRDGLLSASNHDRKRLCYVTHSQGSVDLVNAIAEELTASADYIRLFGKDGVLEVRTLYDLANEHLRFLLRDLTPVSLDGHEGRRFQYDLIILSLKEAWSSKTLQSRYSSISAPLRSRWQKASDDKDHVFVAELMNEFSSIIDAENIRRGEENAEKYIKRPNRPKWLLSLPTEADRKFVLEIHSIYKKHLVDMNALSVDEMIADFNAYLNSNAWDRERNRVGYDAVFVDELHLFTSLEKQTLQKIVKREVDDLGTASRPNIFMAYDIKQSPRDTFLDYFSPDGSIFTASSGLQGSELVQLSKVFRYTPQIADFLKDLDAAFPAIDIPGEWGAYVGDAELPDSDVVKLLRFEDDLKLLESVFQSATKLARKIEGGGRRVGVLCVSEEVFDIYMPPVRGRFRSSVFLVDSRESTSELRHVGKRFIFSMPEYVAGLQFHTVFLIHVNQAEAPSSAGIGRRRQLISNTYLGASRAENSLFLACSELRGGPSDILQLALDRNSLIETA